MEIAISSLLAFYLLCYLCSIEEPPVKYWIDMDKVDIFALFLCLKRHTISVLYRTHLCMKCSLGNFNFLEAISSLSHSVVFLYFFALTLKKAFLSLLAILWNSAFKWEYLSFSPLLFASLLSTAICKASSDNHFAFLHLFSTGMVLISVSCTMSWTSIHSSAGTLSIRSSPLNLFLTSPV